MKTIPTPGWNGGRSRTGPLVQVHPVCSCGLRLEALPPCVFPVRAGESPPASQVRVESRTCGGCGEVTRVKVHEVAHG